MKSCTIIAIGILLASALSAHAYIGPGIGVTMIGWFIGLIAAIFAAFSAAIFWPLQTLLKKARFKSKVRSDSSTSRSSTSSD